MKYSCWCKECKQDGLFTLSFFFSTKMPLEENLKVDRWACHNHADIRVLPLLPHEIPSVNDLGNS